MTRIYYNSFVSLEGSEFLSMWKILHTLSGDGGKKHSGFLKRFPRARVKVSSVLVINYNSDKQHMAWISACR